MLGSLVSRLFARRVVAGTAERAAPRLAVATVERAAPRVVAHATGTAAARAARFTLPVGLGIGAAAVGTGLGVNVARGPSVTAAAQETAARGLDLPGTVITGGVRALLIVGAVLIVVAFLAPSILKGAKGLLK